MRRRHVCRCAFLEVVMSGFTPRPTRHSGAVARGGLDDAHAYLRWLNYGTDKPSVGEVVKEDEKVEKKVKKKVEKKATRDEKPGTFSRWPGGGLTERRCVLGVCADRCDDADGRSGRGAEVRPCAQAPAGAGCLSECATPRALWTCASR